MKRGRASNSSSIFDHLHVWKKLAIIAALATLPGAVLLYLLVNEKSVAIRAAQQEMYGTQYLRPLIALQRRMHELALVQAAIGQGEAGSPEEASAIVATIQQDVAALDAVHAAFHSRIAGAGEHGLAL